MRCSKCQSSAWVEMRRHNSAYCAEHYVEFFESRVQKNIKSLKMFTSEDKLLVAVSGGKDSLSLWDVLLRSGYKATGLYIDLGITEYSGRSRQKCEAFAALHSAPLIVRDIRAEFGAGMVAIPELARITRRVPCSGCGLSKRYIFNSMARAGGFTVIATGHNLDDEAATLLGNVLHWQTGYLARQAPVMESTHPSLARKVKPLYTFTERETLSYALIREIDYLEEECPHAQGASSILYKEVLNRIELESPGTKANFMVTFLDRARGLFEDRERGDVTACIRCGEPTTTEVCAFCRIWERAREPRTQHNPRQHRRHPGNRSGGEGAETLPSNNAAPAESNGPQ